MTICLAILVRDPVSIRPIGSKHGALHHSEETRKVPISGCTGLSEFGLVMDYLMGQADQSLQPTYDIHTGFLPELLASFETMCSSCKCASSRPQQDL